MLFSLLSVCVSQDGVADGGGLGAQCQCTCSEHRVPVDGAQSTAGLRRPGHGSHGRRRGSALTAGPVHHRARRHRSVIRQGRRHAPDPVKSMYIHWLTMCLSLQLLNLFRPLLLLQNKRYHLVQPVHSTNRKCLVVHESLLYCGSVYLSVVCCGTVYQSVVCCGTLAQ